MVRGIKRAETVFESEWGGEWCAMTFWNKATGSEQVALVKGLIDPGGPTLVRMHALSPFADLFGEAGERRGPLRQSMRIIGEEGAGVVVVINRPRPDGLTLAIHARSGTPMPDVEELRDYGVGAMILNEFGRRGHGGADQHPPHAGRARRIRAADRGGATAARASVTNRQPRTRHEKAGRISGER